MLILYNIVFIVYMSLFYFLPFNDIIYFFLLLLFSVIFCRPAVEQTCSSVGQ